MLNGFSRDSSYLDVSAGSSLEVAKEDFRDSQQAFFSSFAHSVMLCDLEWYILKQSLKTHILLSSSCPCEYICARVDNAKSG